MLIQEFSYLPEDAISIRQEIFVEEQGFQNEFDDIDKVATHLVLYENDFAIATCRIFFDSNKDCYKVGRIAVRKIYRGKSYGAKILQYAEEFIRKNNGKKVALHAQVQAAIFY